MTMDSRGQVQKISENKNVSVSRRPKPVMAGGFLYVINFGAGAISFDEGVTVR
jgi:hypothetical protein